MADHLIYESPITASYPEVANASVTLSDHSSLAKILVKASPDTAAAAQMAVGFGASRAEFDQTSQTQVLVLGQRPDEWLLLGERAAANAYLATIDRSGHVSVVDHTHARAMFHIAGDDSRKILAKICNLDWSDAMTPNGAVVSASVAKVGCDIARRDEPSGRPAYLLACDRSFAQFLFDAILDAGLEFELGVQNRS